MKYKKTKEENGNGHKRTKKLLLAVILLMDVGKIDEAKQLLKKEFKIDLRQFWGR